MAGLSKSELLNVVMQAVRAGGKIPLAIEAKHPFLVRLIDDEGLSSDARLYVWNCTHGGNHRPDDELRVQATTLPSRDPAVATYILGWHEEKQVFAAWDIDKHDGQTGSSPSMQIKEETLDAALTQVFPAHVKAARAPATAGEIVVAFRPEFLADYLSASESLHGTSAARRDMALLDHVDTLTEAQINAVADKRRRKVLRKVWRDYRDHKFAKAVLNAYGHACAFCGVQLALLDGAHILPVCAPGSTDDVTNGVALCKLHHYAYDSNLVSFDERFRIEVSAALVADLTAISWAGGLAEFKRGFGRSILLPSNPRQRPLPAFVTAARRYRRWRA